MKTMSAVPGLSPELIQRYDLAGPRYTSYPTADRFVEAFSADDYGLALDTVAPGMPQSAAPLSVYVHIPFCESLCYYCGCNKIVTRHHEHASRYLQYLEREAALHRQRLGQRKPVSQLHWGGGTPTFLSDAELEQLMRML